MTDKIQIYVATSWRNPFHAELVRMLRDAGHGVYDFKAEATAFDWREVLPPDATALPRRTDSRRRRSRLLKARAGFDADTNSDLVPPVA